MNYRLPLVFAPRPEGGFMVTSPLLPELITERNDFDDVVENVRDALTAAIEIYRETRLALTPDLLISNQNGEVRADLVIGHSNARPKSPPDLTSRL